MREIYIESTDEFTIEELQNIQKVFETIDLPVELIYRMKIYVPKNDDHP